MMLLPRLIIGRSDRGCRAASTFDLTTPHRCGIWGAVSHPYPRASFLKNQDRRPYLHAAGWPLPLCRPALPTRGVWGMIRRLRTYLEFNHRQDLP